jgi:hypothetical protein
LAGFAWKTIGVKKNPGSGPTGGLGKIPAIVFLDPLPVIEILELATALAGILAIDVLSPIATVAHHDLAAAESQRVSVSESE